MSETRIRNMEEFATVSGISRPTVSKYFNDPDSVRKSTRQRIEAALERYDYRPNIYAINQNRRLTKNIGVVVPYLADPFFAEIARNIENLIIRTGFRPILLSSHGSCEQEIENLDSLRDIRPAGLLMAPLGRRSDKEAIAAICEEVPTILFDSNIEDLGQAFVGHDNFQATELACDYLCRGGEPPAFFEMLTPTNPNAYRRRNTYIATMERLGHPVELVQAEGDGWDFEAIGYREALRVLAGQTLRSRTVLCSNDRLAIGFLAAAYELGVRVGTGAGSELRVAGHDDHPFSRYTCPQLTTVAQDYRSIAQKSVDLLMRLIETGEGPERRETKLFHGHLILRKSA